MALPPIPHCEKRSKIRAPGHIAIGTCTTIGCNGCPSHFPFRKANSHFIGWNCALYIKTLLLISSAVAAAEGAREPCLNHSGKIDITNVFLPSNFYFLLSFWLHRLVRPVACHVGTASKMIVSRVHAT